MLEKHFNKIRFIFFALLLLQVARVLWDSQINNFIVSKEVSSFEKEIDMAYSTLLRRVERWSNKKDPKRRVRPYADKVHRYIYDENDSLVFWSSSNVPVDKRYWEGSFSTLSYLRNGWYLSATEERDNKHYVMLYKIRSEFPIHNQYLSSGVNDNFSSASDFEISVNPFDGQNHPITLGNDGDFTFYIKPIININKHKNPLIVMDLLFLLFLFLFIASWPKYKQRKETKLVIGLFILIGLRIVSLIYGYPQNLYEFELFNPKWFASGELTPSIGDLLWNLFTAVILVLILRMRVQNVIFFQLNRSKILRYILYFVVLLIYVAIGVFIIYQIKNIIINSTLPLNISSIYSFPFLSYAAYLNVCILLILFYLLTDFLFNRMLKRGAPINSILFGVLLVFTAIIISLVSLVKPLEALFFIFFAFITYFRSFLFKGNSSFYILNIGAFSLFSAYTVETTLLEKQKENMVFFAEALKNNRDLSFEISIQNYLDRIQDYNAQTLYDYNIEDIDIKEYTHTVTESYFLKYLPKYDIHVYVYDGKQLLFSSASNEKTKSYLKGIMASAKQTNIPQLYNSDYVTTDEDYILYFERPQEALNNFEIFITFSSKSYKDIAGFPLLLRDDQTSSSIEGFSYARYRKNTLINKYGTYNYPYSSEIFQNIGGTSMHNVVINDYHHYLLEAPQSKIIVSIKAKAFTDYLNTFSFLFIFLSICFLIPSIILHYNKLSFRDLSLYNKVQIFIMSFLVFSILIIAVGTYMRIRSEFERRNETLLKDKVRSVLFEIEHKIGHKERLSSGEDQQYLEAILNKFSNVFYTDISLYAKNGDLLASSASYLYNQGIIMEKMNPTAFYYSQKINQAELIQQENIGNLYYLSAYVPVLNDQGKFLAHLNLPYFIKQQDFDQEWGAFLSALLNIYLFLFLLFLMGSLLLSSWITKPLKTIREILENMDIEKSNQILTYQGKDEIGEFVKVYNKKVLELSEKTAQLAQTQKEVAWREMAKQVAHEIKNPLTPMKLSVQHLIHSLKVDDLEAQERLLRFGDRMIEQINVLSGIATEFSNFAKLPSASFEEISLQKLIIGTVELYTNPDGGNPIVIEHLDTQPETILADKNQILRLLQNLIRNAIQAIADKENGEIKIRAKSNLQHIYVEIEDNGAGIPEEIQEKIFEPNFTTKSSGTGLGLAMCKRIIEQHQGELGFTTSEKGTCFWFKLNIQ